MSLFCLDLRRNSSPRRREAYTIEMTLNYKSWLVRKSILVPWLARQWNLSRFCQLQLTITLLLLIVPKVTKNHKIWNFFFWKNLRSKRHRAKVSPKRFHLTGNTMRFHPDIHKLQHAEKVVLDSPGLVYFAIGLVDSLLNLLDRQVKSFGEFNYYRRTVNNIDHQLFFKLVEMTFRLTSDVNVFVNAKSHVREKPLLAGYGKVWLLKKTSTNSKFLAKLRGKNGRQGTFTSLYFTYNSMKSWVSIAGLKGLELAVFCCATPISKLLWRRFPVIYILLFYLDHRKWPFWWDQT